MLALTCAGTFGQPVGSSRWCNCCRSLHPALMARPQCMLRKDVAPTCGHGSGRLLCHCFEQPLARAKAQVNVAFLRFSPDGIRSIGKQHCSPYPTEAGTEVEDKPSEVEEGWRAALALWTMGLGGASPEFNCWRYL